jgi:hypothetical protein
MTPDILIQPAAPTIAAVLICVVLAIVLVRGLPDFLGWARSWRALWRFYRRSRGRHRIIAALEMIDGLLSQPDPKVQDAAEIRSTIRRLLAVTAAEHLAERTAVEAIVAPPGGLRHRRP